MLCGKEMIFPEKESEKYSDERPPLPVNAGSGGLSSFPGENKKTSEQSEVSYDGGDTQI